jgi:hypothetical protein
MQWEMARAASEQQALGACVESLQGHVVMLFADGPSNGPSTRLSQLALLLVCKLHKLGDASVISWK